MNGYFKTPIWEFQYLIHLSIGINWLSFLIHIVVILVLDIISDFQLTPRHFGCILEDSWSDLNFPFYQSPYVDLVVSLPWCALVAMAIHFLNPCSAILDSFVPLSLLGLLLLSGREEGTSPGYLLLLGDLCGEAGATGPESCYATKWKTERHGVSLRPWLQKIKAPTCLDCEQGLGRPGLSLLWGCGWT